MLESMTGYGRGEHFSENIRAVAEIRSVNYRYSEITIKLPPQLQIYEQPLKEKIQKKVTRGKISLSVQIDYWTPDDTVHLHEETLKQKIAILEKVRTLAGISEPLRLEHLLVFKELFEQTEIDTGIFHKQFKVAELAVMNSVEELLDMRLNEGRHLQKDLEERMAMLHTLCESVGSSEKERIIEAKARMLERLSFLIEDDRIDETRLEQEIALLSDRLDISEELVRMDSHIRYFIECLADDNSQGKKLNFILQEMHREVNTIGSKASHSGISRMVVEMKEIIENIREQIQNIA